MIIKKETIARALVEINDFNAAAVSRYRLRIDFSILQQQTNIYMYACMYVYNITQTHTCILYVLYIYI